MPDIAYVYRSSLYYKKTFSNKTIISVRLLDRWFDGDCGAAKRMTGKLERRCNLQLAVQQTNAVAVQTTIRLSCWFSLVAASHRMNTSRDSIF